MFSKNRYIEEKANLKAQATMLIEIDRYLAKVAKKPTLADTVPANEALNTVISIVPFIRRNAGI
jgi:hypothetical protein